MSSNYEIIFHDFVTEHKNILVINEEGIEDWNLLQIFEALISKLIDHEKDNIVLFLDDPNHEGYEGYQENQDNNQIFFNDEDYKLFVETEKDGETKRILTFECFFRPKHRLCVYFFADENPGNRAYYKKIYDWIKDSFLIDEKLRDYLELEKSKIEFKDKIETISIEDNDLIVVVSTGKFVTELSLQLKVMYSFLIFTSDANLESFKKNFEGKGSCKKAGVRINEFLQDEYFLKELGE